MKVFIKTMLTWHHKFYFVPLPYTSLFRFTLLSVLCMIIQRYVRNALFQNKKKNNLNILLWKLTLDSIQITTIHIHREVVVICSTLSWFRVVSICNFNWVVGRDLITTCKWSCGKVMFSVMSICPRRGGGI